MINVFRIYLFAVDGISGQLKSLNLILNKDLSKIKCKTYFLFSMIEQLYFNIGRKYMNVKYCGNIVDYGGFNVRGLPSCMNECPHEYLSK